MDRSSIKAALKTLIDGAFPDARIEGFDGAPVKPDRIDADGLVQLESEGSGEEQVDLNPVTYNKTALFEIVIAAPDAAGCAAMASALGLAIVSDRQLGGACEWLDANAGETDDLTEDGMTGHFEARVTVSAEYSTTNPLD